MQITPQQRKNMVNETCCVICGDTFLEFEDKVADHNHYFGTYNGLAHKICNLNRPVAETINIYGKLSYNIIFTKKNY